MDLEQQVQALYKEQQNNYNSSFKNKRDQIKKQYDEFWSHPSAKADVAAYLDQTAGHVYADLPNWVRAKTVFTNHSNKLVSNEHCSIIGNRSSFDVAQYQDNPRTASMSMIHLLGIPKACIYNGVSLTPETVSIIDSVIKLFQESWPKEEFRKAVLEHQRLAIERQYHSKSNPTPEDIHGYHVALRHCAELEGYINGLSVDDFEFALHLYKDHSVGHLHVHIVAMRRHMRQYSTTEHDAKSKDAIEVRDFITSLK